MGTSFKVNIEKYQFLPINLWTKSLVKPYIFTTFYTTGIYFLIELPNS